MFSTKMTFAINNCDMIWCIRCVGVCVGASQRIPLSVLARNPHKGPVRETRSGRGNEGPRGARKTFSRREQKRIVGMREQ